MFTRFDRIHERDRQTDRHRMMAWTALMHSVARQKKQPAAQPHAENHPNTILTARVVIKSVIRFPRCAAGQAGTENLDLVRGGHSTEINFDTVQLDIDIRGKKRTSFTCILNALSAASIHKSTCNMLHQLLSASWMDVKWFKIITYTVLPRLPTRYEALLPYQSYARPLFSI